MLRFISAIMIMIVLSGCAEFTNRGGTIDWIEDKALFKADTKALRVIRSYVLVAGLTRIAAKAPLSLEERGEVSQKIQTAVGLSRDAYDCVYGGSYQPHGCIFFDDIMSQLDAAIIRLARITFLPEENKDLIAVLQKEMFGGDLPSNLFGAAGKIVEGAAEVGIAGGQAANVVGALMRLGQNALRAGGRLGPLYRDSIELQIRIVLDSLMFQARMRNLDCDTMEPPRTDIKLPPTPARFTITTSAENLCADYDQTLNVMLTDGDLTLWRERARAMFQKYHLVMEPQQAHFIQVSTLLVRGCAGLLGGQTDAADTCAKVAFKKKNGKKIPVDSARGLIFADPAWSRAWDPNPVVAISGAVN